jgi:Bacterial membrane protein YfhO
VDELITAQASRRRLVWCALISLVVLAVAAISAGSFPDFHGNRSGQSAYVPVSIAWGASVIVALTAAGLQRSRRLRALALAALVSIDAVALFVVPQLSAPRNVRTDLAPVAYLRDHLGLSRFVAADRLRPNYGSYFGLSSLNVTDGVLPRDFARFARSRLNLFVVPTLLAKSRQLGQLISPVTGADLLPKLSAYRFAGVAYVLTPAGLRLPQSPTTFTLVFRSPSTWIYRVEGASAYFTAAQPRCAVHPHDQESVSVSCPAPTTLVRRETYLPGWQASVDGHDVSIAPSAGLFQAIPLSAGSHEISFSYEPPGVGWGLAAFAVGCVWLLGAGVTSRRARPA